ncbi:hypothetical protein D3C76_1160390 [compost metagenome]
MSVADRANRRPVTEVRNHQPAVRFGNIQQGPGLLRNIAVGGAVEPVTTHAQLLKEAIRQAVEIGLWRERLVETGIKHRHLLHAWEQLLRGFHAAEVSVVVQRSQGGNLTDLVDNLIGDQGGLAEQAATVSDTVAN